MSRSRRPTPREAGLFRREGVKSLEVQRKREVGGWASGTQRPESRK